MKPKRNYTPGPMDNCQTPSYALAPILPYIQDATVWESAMGEGLLMQEFSRLGLRAVGTDISMKDRFNFFEYDPVLDGIDWDVQITNPPYGRKYAWLDRSYQLDRPFALLLPVETLGAKSAQVLFREYGVQVIFMDSRVDFGMPNKGFQGSAQFPTAWFTWGLRLPSDMMFVHIDKPSKKRIYHSE